MAVRYHPLPSELFRPRELQPFMDRFNRELRDLFGLEGVIKERSTRRRSDRTVTRGGEIQVHASRITPSVESIAGIQFFQQASTPTVPQGLAFWLKTTAPSEFYVAMRVTGGSWAWVPVQLAP